MLSLLELPRELRDQIWVWVCHADLTLSSPSAYCLLRTCKQLNLELAPILYEFVTVYLRHPWQVLQWIGTIGAYNSSCIRRLTMKYSMLDLNSRKTNHDDALDVWSSALSTMPNLKYLTYHYDPSSLYVPHYRFNVNGSRALLNLKIHLNITTLPKREIPDVNSRDGDAFQRPPMRDPRLTHAMLAVHEPVPQINCSSFMHLLGLNPALSIEQNVTRLPPGFLDGCGLQLRHTYTACSNWESLQNQSVTLTYSRLNSSISKVVLNVQLMLSNLPSLVYLRLGCQEVDSSFLAFMPADIHTLDVAFQDPDPAHVSRNLRLMRQRCPKLFTLAIAVSPLHDAYHLPDGGRAVNQHTTGEAGFSHWESFWEALRFVQSTGVKVWEGHGPGVKKW